MMNQRKIFLALLPILTIFDSYCITYFGTMPLTISFIGIAITFILSIVTNFKIEQKYFWLLCTVFIVIILSTVFNLESIKFTSIGLYIFYFSFFCFSSHYDNDKTNLKSLKWLLLLINLIGIIAILQMVSNFTSMPRFDVVINGHMVKGFNRVSTIYIGNYSIVRSNGIYLEPSTLSQYSCLGIIISFYLKKNMELSMKKFVISLVICFTSLICSFAGTGLLVFGIILFIAVLRKKYTIKDLMLFLLGLIIVLAVSFVMTDNFKLYLSKRLLEATDETQSGGMRFTYPYIMMFKTYSVNIFGYGCGNEGECIKFFYPKMYDVQKTVASGYAKIGIELGVFGIGCLIYSVKQIYTKKYLYFFIFIILFNFVGGNLLQPAFWCFMAFFNLKKDEVKI